MVSGLGEPLPVGASTGWWKPGKEGGGRVGRDKVNNNVTTAWVTTETER